MLRHASERRGIAEVATRRHSPKSSAALNWSQSRDKLEIAMEWTGGCLCGAVRYETSSEPIWVGHCHCRWCQKHSGSAFTTCVMFRGKNVVWLDVKPAVYESSAGVERGFCPICGSTLSFARPDRDEITVFAGSLDNPNVISPSVHIFAEQQCEWLRLNDGLPCHDRFPPGGEDREPE
jgi:hypothetical protein